MKKYVFSGKVVPERANVTITGLEPVILLSKDFELEVKVVLSIIVSQISVHAEIIKGTPDIYTLRNYVANYVRTAVNSLGYLKGCGYDLELSSATDEAGTQTVFGVDIASIAQDENKRPVSFVELINLTLRSQELNRALADLSQAIRSSLDTGFFCFRAVESISKYFLTEGESNNAEGFRRMELDLNFKRSYIRLLDTFGGDQRHGETPYMSGADRENCMKTAWQIVDRFCVYLKNNDTQLDETVHPLLDVPPS